MLFCITNKVLTRKKKSRKSSSPGASRMYKINHSLTMNKNLIHSCTTVLAVFSVLGALTSCDEATNKQQSSAAIPPPDVQVTELIHRDVPITAEWIGSLRGTEDAEIRPRVSGYLLSKDYKDGAYVKKGEILFRIDPRPFQAALDQARGQLAQARANAEKFSLDVKRYTPLVESGSVSRKQLDDAVQSLKQAEASIKTSEASVADAEINLKFTTIDAPISGLAGLAQPSIGDLLSPTSSEALTTISSIDPIRVDYSISENQLLDAFEKNGIDPEKEKFQVILANGKPYSELGTPVAVDRNVSRQTGTINIVGQIPNPKHELRPGMFVRIRAVVKVIKNATLVPPRSIMKVQSMSFILGIGKDNIPFIFPVKPGPVVDHLQVVEPLKGEFPPKMSVVVEGVLQAASRQGKAPINPVPYVFQESQPIINSKAVSDFDDKGKLKTPGQQPVSGNKETK